VVCNDVRSWGARLVAEARALRAAYPDAVATGALEVSDVPAELDGRAGAALRHLRDEMLLVRAGQVGTLVVLDDEMAIVERLLGPGAAGGGQVGVAS
jgi:hypothetical protein